ncbi:hypothetical protein R9C00_27710 [Flammeovirgaceae bacterium SG7u.111]|nr:hypothetical protein [Flammeovirgaceae bacterium SG7u.132]WPO35488.1 hypothetical protein R9C00_27710 [Flammeovirgaceae bacterium SG7u.111]
MDNTSRLLFYGELNNGLDYSYQKDWAVSFKARYKHIPFFDVDNHSDQSMLTYAKQLIEESKPIVLVLSLNDAEELGIIKTIVSILVKKKGEMFFVKVGNHPMLDKMLKLVKKEMLFELESEDQIIPIIEKILNHG